MSAKSQHNLPDIWLAIAPSLLLLLLLLRLLLRFLVLWLLLLLLLFVCFCCAHNKMGTLNACQFAALWEIFQANRVGALLLLLLPGQLLLLLQLPLPSTLCRLSCINVT